MLAANRGAKTAFFCGIEIFTQKIAGTNLEEGIVSFAAWYGKRLSIKMFFDVTVFPVELLLRRASFYPPFLF